LNGEERGSVGRRDCARKAYNNVLRAQGGPPWRKMKGRYAKPKGGAPAAVRGRNLARELAKVSEKESGGTLGGKFVLAREIGTEIDVANKKY